MERGEEMDDFERIYTEYYDQVYGYCLRLTHDPHLAEEVTQESFFKALKAIDSFHGECRLSVWLCHALKIHQVLHRLEDPYREVFWLRTFGELSFAQIAGLFEKTESWARVTYHRARIKIKEALE